MYFTVKQVYEFGESNFWNHLRKKDPTATSASNLECWDISAIRIHIPTINTRAAQ